MTTDGVEHAENGNRERTPRDVQHRGNGSPRSTNGAIGRTTVLAADRGPGSEGE